MSTPFGVLATSSLPLIVSFANLNGTLANGTSTVNGTVGIGDLGSDGGGGMLRYVWAVYCILLGGPLLLCGFRLRQFTCGAGCALSICVSLWAALVNSTPSSGFSSTPLDSDLAIALPTLILSLSAFSLGWLRAFTYIGHLLLTTAAGVALVLQVVLFKEELVVPSLQGVLALMGAGGLGGLFVGIWKQRVGVLMACTISGGFLLSLAVNLILEKEDGMSYGLRVILDGEASTLKREDFRPTLKTQVNLSAGLGLMLVMFIIQYFAFPGDFIRSPEPTIWSSLPPSHAEGRATPFSLSRHVSMASSFEAITPQDPAYQRPWMKKSGLNMPLIDEGEEGMVDPIPISIIPPETTKHNKSYSTISLHQDSPYTLSTAELRAKELVPPVPDLPALLQTAPSAYHPVDQSTLHRSPSSASSISQYPPTPIVPASYHRAFSSHPSNEPRGYSPPINSSSILAAPPSAFFHATPQPHFKSAHLPDRMSNPFDGLARNEQEYTPPNSKADLLGAVQGLYSAGEERRDLAGGSQKQARFLPPSQARF